MSRKRKRTTNRRRQEDRHLSVRAVRRHEPDVKKLSRAFIALALAQAQAEADAAAHENTTHEEDERPGQEALDERP